MTSGPTSTTRSLKRAAIAGAIVGAALILVNVFLTRDVAAAGVLPLALMALGGALGGAVLFVFVAWIGSFLFR